MTKIKTNKGAIFLIALLAFMVMCVPLIKVNKANADTMTIHRFDHEQFAKDFKWTTYSYELVDTHNPYVGTGGFENETALQNWGNSFGIGYEMLMIDPYGNKRIVIKDNIENCLTIDSSVYYYNFDLVEVQMISVDNTYYSMVANKKDNCIISFDDLAKSTAYVLSINFYKVKNINDGTKSWNVNLSVTSDLSDTVLYSETFIPKSDYSLMYSAYMGSSANNLGRTLGAYYGTVDALKNSETPSYNLTSAGFSSSLEYEQALAGYNTNYSRYNTAYKTLTANGTNYAGSNLNTYYGYDEIVEIEDSNADSESNSASTSTSENDNPGTSDTNPDVGNEEDPGNDDVNSGEIVNPDISDDGTPDDGDDEQDNNDGDKDDTVQNRELQIVDYDDNQIGAITILSEQYVVSKEEFENAIGDIECQKWCFIQDDGEGNLREVEFVPGETIVTETIKIYPKVCNVTVYGYDFEKLVVIKVPFNTCITNDMITEAVGYEVSNSYTWGYETLLLNYDFSKPVVFDFNLYGLFHEVKIKDIALEDSEDVSSIIAQGVISNGRVLDEEFILSLIPESVEKYKVESILIINFVSGNYDFIKLNETIDSQDVLQIDIRVSIQNTVAPPDNEKEEDEPTLKDENSDLIEDENGSTDIPSDDGKGDLTLGDHGHDFKFKLIDFPCKDCGMSFWTYLWQIGKYYIISGIIGLALVVAFFVVLAIVKR